MPRLTIVSGLLIMLVSVAFLGATEGGGGAYQLGAEGWKLGVAPAPGLHLVNYTTSSM